MNQLQSFTAVVTGGIAGIGLACAQALLAAGADALLINGRDAARAKDARNSLTAEFPHARVLCATGDIGRAADAGRVMAAAQLCLTCAQPAAGA
jgi:NAD(P)-dependent dehydrogenase (short-subunit alcohol dehydrogenase family)